MSLSEKGYPGEAGRDRSSPSMKEAIQTGLSGVEVSAEQLNEIVSQVSSDYQHSRVEPCEAVGVVAAQSIGEPAHRCHAYLPLRGVAEINRYLGLRVSSRL